MKSDLTEVDAEKFEIALNEFRTSRPAGFSGPFIHSAPGGTLFDEPFRKFAWVVGAQTVLVKWEQGSGLKSIYYALT